MRAFKTALLATALVGAMSVTPAKAEFYVNPFAGMLVTDTTAYVGGEKLVDLGGDAPFAGVRAGWNSGNAFLYGAELEAFAADGRSRVMLNNGLTYTQNYDYGVGAYARVGWRTPGNAIAFARVGVLNTNVDTRVDFGVGAEIPFAPNTRFRIDLGYAPGDIEFFRLSGGIVIAF